MQFTVFFFFWRAFSAEDASSVFALFFPSLLQFKKEGGRLLYSTSVAPFKESFLFFIFGFFSCGFRGQGVEIRGRHTIDLLACLLPSVCLALQSVDGKPDVNVPWGWRDFHLPKLSV